MEAGAKTRLLISSNVTAGGVVNRTAYYTPQVLFKSLVVRSLVLQPSTSPFLEEGQVTSKSTVCCRRH